MWSTQNKRASLTSCSRKNIENHNEPSTQCLKITEKVSFNIAGEASYVYFLNGLKLIKNVKNGPFWRVFENLMLAVQQCYQTGQFKIGQKLVDNVKIQKIEMRHFEKFSNNVEK